MTGTRKGSSIYEERTIHDKTESSDVQLRL